MDDKTRQVAKGFRSVGLDFILTELDIAISFCDMALASSNAERSARNAQQAKRAWQSALQFTDRVRLNDADQREIAERTDRLDSMLKQLDERHNASFSDS